MIAVAAIVAVGLAAGLLRLLPLAAKPTTGVPRVVFAAFGATSDVLFIAPATRPDERTVVDTVQHAEGWGINPGPMFERLLAYNVVPAGAPAGRGAPSELWLLNVATGERTRLARDADLLVKPQFVADGKSILYRRTDGDLQQVVRVDIDSLARTMIYEERTAFGVFPLGVDANGTLLFARLSNTGTDVLRKAGDASPVLAFHASDEIARDWQLSPDGKSLAFLAPLRRAERVVYRAAVVMIEGGKAVALPEGDASGEQYGPLWTPDGGSVAVGQEAASGAATPVVLLRAGGAPVPLATPARGFDVPVAWSAAGTYLAARTFDGQNSTNVGRESAVVIARSGERYPVSAPGEVILLGWLPDD
ncbi:MAG: hypothetical protein WC273_01400 [Dehalococcoidia bacterium]